MPVIEVHLIEGYGADDKRRLAENLTDAARLVVPAPPEAVTVMIQEHGADEYFRGRIGRDPAPALPEPATTVQRFLTCMEARDLDAAEAMLGEGFTMQFPGAAPMTALAELVAWAKPRYASISKTYSGFDTGLSAGDAQIVYCHGTLAGTWRDGTSFAGIRFVDRFELQRGKITRQDVWNDIGEMLRTSDVPAAAADHEPSSDA